MQDVVMAEFSREQPGVCCGGPDLVGAADEPGVRAAGPGLADDICGARSDSVLQPLASSSGTWTDPVMTLYN